jgi:histidinol-phosphatase (PHP family)
MVSVHGGHSGEFCNHAVDSLEEIVKTYVAKGFSWMGITEHMPPIEDRYVYPDERSAGLDAAALRERFDRYFKVCKALQAQYRDRIEILAGFETEWYAGGAEYVKDLIQQYVPDYIVGSLHHVADLELDTTLEDYSAAATALGGVEALYIRYFDEQYELIETLKPAVVGHFDLVRIFDSEYASRIDVPEVRKRVTRNLELIRDLDLILDFNLAGYDKPGGEPYPSDAILKEAIDLGIALVPGDDSHGIATVGRHWEKGIAALKARDADMSWRHPG